MSYKTRAKMRYRTNGHISDTHCVCCKDDDIDDMLDILTRVSTTTSSSRVYENQFRIFVN